MKQALIRGGVALCRSYCSAMPGTVGKRAVWFHALMPMLASRDLVLEGTTRFGARMRLRPPDTIQTYIYVFGVWEPSISAYLTQALGPGDIVIDVGANVGYDTLLASARVGATGRVYAVEASPALFGHLTENLALNGIANTTTILAAACAEACEVPVYLHGRDNRGGTTILPGIAATRSATLETTVRGAPLTALIPPDAIRRARVIKIDVEGAEWAVVRGIQPLLPELSPRTELLIEVSAAGLRQYGASVAGFIAMFRYAGYKPFVIGNDYCLDEYLTARPAPPVPLEGTDFEQADILFRKA